MKLYQKLTIFAVLASLLAGTGPAMAKRKKKVKEAKPKHHLKVTNPAKGE
ncbi:MAG: hypothetical protein HYS22_06175 [Deltaproteobacteria bacterium]|nr:hypothetical protein [Deltaproteobacteria bacterium]